MKARKELYQVVVTDDDNSLHLNGRVFTDLRHANEYCATVGENRRAFPVRLWSDSESILRRIRYLVLAKLGVEE